MLAPLTLAQYEKEFRNTGMRRRLDGPGIATRSARHGGPSTAARPRAMGLADAEKRGRWLTIQWALRCEKTGKLFRQVALMGPQGAARGAELLETKNATSSFVAPEVLHMAKNLHRLRWGLPAKLER